MKAWITKQFGEYVLKYKDKSLSELQEIAALVEQHTGIEARELDFTND